MRAVGAVITLICGIAVLVGTFLPWLSKSILGFTISRSGWDIVDTSGFDLAELIIPDNTHALLVFIGGIVMVACALTAVIISGMGKSARPAIIPLGIVASLAALAAFGGSVWFIIDIMDKDLADFMSYGLYMSAGAALLGTIFGTIMTLKA